MSDLFPGRLATSGRYDVAAVISCVFILVLALTVGYFREVGNFFVETDFYGAYASQAKNILSGRSYTYQHQPPGYSLLLGITSLVTGDLFAAGKIITTFATALFGWLTYLLLRSLFDPRMAFTATFLTLIVLIPFSFLVATDMLAALFVILSVWVLLRKPVLTSTACFWAGILAGAGYLVRYSGSFVLMGILFSLLFVNINQESWSKRLVRASLFLGGTLLITTPWLVINWQTNGSPFASTVHLQVAGHFYLPLGDVHAARMAFGFDSLLDVILYDPIRFSWQYIKSVGYTYLANLTQQGLKFPTYLFAGAGLVLLLKNLCRRKVTLLIICLAVYLPLGLGPFYLRYYIPLFPVLYLLVAYFLWHGDALTNLKMLWFSSLSVAWVLLVLLTLYLSYDSYRQTSVTLSSEPKYLLEIGELLQERSAPDDVMIAFRPHYGYFAKMKSIFPAAKNADEYLALAQEAGARYIIYSDAEVDNWPPLEFLKDPDVAPDSFKLIYRHEPTNTLIYEIVDKT